MSLSGSLRRWARACSHALRFAGRRVSVDPSSWVSAGARLSTRGGGSITIGRHCEIHPHVLLMTYGGDIRIGDRCSINPFSIVYGHGGTTLGHGVRVAAHTVIIPANHQPGSERVAVHAAPLEALGIEIGDNVWIGAGARILDGVRIGRNAVVGAGAVVTRAVPADATVAGVPAAVIRQR